VALLCQNGIVEPQKAILQPLQSGIRLWYLHTEIPLLQRSWPKAANAGSYDSFLDSRNPNAPSKIGYFSGVPRPLRELLFFP
jgi:hypothetical protein